MKYKISKFFFDYQQPLTDVFISYAWKNDRSYNAKVDDISEALKKHFIVWRDKEAMRFNMLQAMTDGIARTKVVVVLATKEYKRKVDSADITDNCFTEFIQAGNKILVLCMDDMLSDVRVWQGIFASRVQQNLCYDFSMDFNNSPQNFKSTMEKLVDDIKLKILSIQIAQTV